MQRAAGGLALMLMGSGCAGTSDVTIAPPRVPQGGRAVVIAVAPSNAKRIIVGTESGGLFRTFDGGVSFQHLDGFPTFAPLGAAIASTDPNIVVATARDDFRTVSGGGIWRSTDGGASWSRPAGWPPAGCSRPEGRSVSHLPLTRTFYVATDCGIAVSTDNGASFSTVVLDPARPGVRDVLVVNRSLGVAVDDQRMWFLNGGTWQPATGGPTTGSDFTINGLATPWWTGMPIFYHAARDFEVYFSTDGGATWDTMATLPHGGGREHVVRVGRGLDGDPTHFDVYFADGFTIFRQAVTTAVPGGTNAWKELKADHRDPADIAFTPGYEEPLMLATDGGVHLTTDQGKTWKLTGSGYGGFTALQIGELTGRAVEGNEPHLDLYYGTQDNDIKGSSDGGHTWDGSIGSEGAFLSADAANPAHVDGPVSGSHTGRLFLAPDHLGNTDHPPAFKSAPNGAENNLARPPAQLIGPTYLQAVTTAGPPASADFFLTGDRGTSWTHAFSLPFPPIGVAKFAGNLGDPVAYVGVKRPSSAIGLFRAQDIATQPVVRRADSIGLGSIGLLRTFQGTYTVFGVDPASPDHLIAADIVAGEMKASADGGIEWFALPALTAAVTDTGKFRFTEDIRSFATVIAWDPTNSCHILVGTMQNGVIRSADGGLTWKRVAGSPVVTYVTSFFFPPSGRIWMSSYGRGLWTLNVDRKRAPNARCAFPSPPGTPPPVAPAARAVAIYVANADPSGIASVVPSGGSAAIYGSGFSPGRGARGVDILIGSDTVAAGLEVRPDGTFMLRVPVLRGPGILDVRAVQRDGRSVVTDRSSITVVESERRQ
jgi:photosystem II stability/assembly factor-like uncharacterized protein